MSEEKDNPFANAVVQIDATPEKNCTQCGENMGYEWLLGPVCGKCCRANHRKVAGK